MNLIKLKFRSEKRNWKNSIAAIGKIVRNKITNMRNLMERMSSKKNERNGKINGM